MKNRTFYFLEPLAFILFFGCVLGIPFVLASVEMSAFAFLIEKTRIFDWLHFFSQEKRVGIVFLLYSSSILCIWYFASKELIYLYQKIISTCFNNRSKAISTSKDLLRDPKKQPRSQTGFRKKIALSKMLATMGHIVVLRWSAYLLIFLFQTTICVAASVHFFECMNRKNTFPARPELLMLYIVIDYVFITYITLKGMNRSFLQVRHFQ